VNNVQSSSAFMLAVLQMSILKLACETDLTERRRINSNSDNNFQDDSVTSHGSLAGNTMVINVTKSGSTNSMMAGTCRQVRVQNRKARARKTN